MSFFLFLASLFETEKPAIWPTKTVTYGFRLTVDDGRSVLSEEYRRIFRRAAKEWTDKTSINLIESKSPDIVVSMKNMLGTQAGYAYHIGEGRGGDIDFDLSDRKWDDDLFYCVALHEIGHALGLKHSRRKFTVMYRNVSKIDELHEFDITALEDLYESIWTPSEE